MHRALPPLALRSPPSRRNSRRSIARGAERAAGPDRVDGHLLGLEAEDGRNRHLLDSLELRAGPALGRAVAFDLDDAVERLHRGVSENRKRELGFDHLPGTAQRRRGIAASRRRQPGTFRQLAIVGEHLCAGTLFGVGVVPLHFKSLAALHRRPGILRQHGNALRNLHDIDHALDGLGSRCVERFHRAAEARRVRHHRGDHAGTADVERIHRLAGGLRHRVDARHVL